MWKVFAKMAIGKAKNFVNLEDNLTKVEAKFARLRSCASDLKEKLIKAEQAGKKKRKKEVETWFDEIQELESDFKELRRKIRDDRLWENLSSGDCLVDIDERIEELMEQRKDFDGQPLLDNHDRWNEPRLTTKLFGKRFQESLEMIWNWLVTEKLSNIGIYGAGGIGKTTLAKHFHNLLLAKTDYKLYWVTVSQEFSIASLQDKIAKLVKLDLSDEDDEDQRAAMLSRSLVQECVLILDDVWKEFPLEKIGIVVGVNKCRVILTTRSLELCHRMHCQRKLGVKTLGTHDAWDLFKHTIGRETVLSVEAEEIAQLIVKKCSGLPLCIIVVAGSMIGVVDIIDWLNTLEQLNTFLVGYEEMEEKVFPVLEWSFNRLNRCEKLCFLYCCLYPEDCHIKREELIDLCIWAELVPRRSSRDLEFNHCHQIFNKLIKVCLLEESDEFIEKCVKMHDVIRDMALRITCGRSCSKIIADVPRFLVKKVEGGFRSVVLEEKEWTKDLSAFTFLGTRDVYGAFDDANRMYLCFKRMKFFIYGSCIEIPPGMSPICPNLSSFVVICSIIRIIPDTFFRHMSGLKVLAIHWCKSLKALPDCVLDLVNLTALFLEGCTELESVPPLGKLKKLRDVNLSCTKIKEVPQGLEELVKLERLYMICALNNKTMQEGTFSKLQHLQQLALSSHISNLQVLKQLQVFVGHLTYAKFFNEFVAFRSCWPKHFQIVVEESPSYYDLYAYRGNDKRMLVFNGCNFQKGLLDVEFSLDDIDKLIIDNCSGMSHVFFHCSRTGFCDLMIRNLNKIEFLLSSSSSSRPPDDQLIASNFVGPLQNINALQLYGLPNFIGLSDWEESSTSSASSFSYSPSSSSSSSSSSSLSSSSCTGRHQKQLIPPEIFSSLRVLNVFHCKKLKKLFPLKVLQQSLQNLEILCVSCCEELEEIVTANEGKDTSIQTGSGVPGIASTTRVRLPKLQDLKLQELPRLDNICMAAMICESIRRIRIYRCPEVKRLPLFLPIKAKHRLPSPPDNLIFIRGNEEWWESLEWDTPNAKDALQPFFQSIEE